MAVLKCKMCGGDVVLAPDKTFGTCEYCGCTMTFPKVNDEQRAAAFNRGNHFRRIGEFDKALEVYERIVAEDDNDAEAHWCCALCRFGIEYVEDPTTYEWLPTCHRASFDSFLEDVDYLAALEHSDGVTRRQYQKDAAKIAEVQRGILATSQNTEPYDVFICYKELDENGKRTRDSILAQEIYYRLKEREWRVFFSRISLEDVPGTQYEPYIFAALNSALVMVVVGTSAENLNSVWVKNEWSRFLSLMKKDHSKLLIPCYRDMDPYDLPDQLSVLMSYDIGRIGFIQDLIRGVDKVLSAEKKDNVTETVKETVVVQQGGGPNVTALIKRGNLALEDGEWENANSFFDQVLNMDAECAEAYLGQGLAEQKCHDTEEYIRRVAQRSSKTERKYLSKDEDRIRKARETYPVEGFLKWDDIKGFYEYDLGYNSSVNAQKEVQNRVVADFEKDRYFARAKRFSSEDAQEPYNVFRKKLIDRLTRNVEEAQTEEKREITRLESRYDEFLNRGDQKAEVQHNAAVQKREEHYLAACQSQEKATGINAYQAAISKFKRIITYKDSLERIKQCEKSISDLEELEKQRIAAEERIAAEKREQERLRKEEEKRIAARAAYEKAEQERLKREEEKRFAAQREAEQVERQRLLDEKNLEIQSKRRLKKKKAGKLLISLFLIPVLLAIPRYYSNRQEEKNMAAYELAESLLSQGEYNEAEKIYIELGDYRDSTKKLEFARDKQNEDKDALYQSALSLYEERYYKTAKKIFEELNDFKDSKEKIIEIDSLIFDLEQTNETGRYSTGTVITFGHFEQDNNTTNGTEDIEWVVIKSENDKALMLSKYALEVLPYNNELESVSWESCSLRSWLNKDFINLAFTEEESKAIITTTVNNTASHGNSEWKIDGGNNTKDKVFLLSYTEAYEYFINATRRCEPSLYCRDREAFTGMNFPGEYCSWWLRSPGKSLKGASIVGIDGVMTSGYVNSSNQSVRPAVWVDLNLIQSK